jgi:hypothetical protein
MYQSELLSVYLVLIEIRVLFVLVFEIHTRAIDDSLELGWIVTKFSDLLHFFNNYEGIILRR